MTNVPVGKNLMYLSQTQTYLSPTPRAQVWSPPPYNACIMRIGMYYADIIFFCSIFSKKITFSKTKWQKKSWLASLAPIFFFWNLCIRIMHSIRIMHHIRIITPHTIVRIGHHILMNRRYVRNYGWGGVSFPNAKKIKTLKNGKKYTFIVTGPILRTHDV